MSKELNNEDMFIVDAKPAENLDIVPSYRQKIDEVVPKQLSLNVTDETNDCAPTGICFNCQGSHSLRDCTKPRDHEAILNNRKKLQTTTRYHLDLEDEQQYGHFQVGCISNELRGALGLGPKQIPMHVYKMRVFGYPPGWLEDHKIKHSGLSLIDAQVKMYQKSNSEDGELVVNGQDCKYDVKKLITYPGFNTKPETGTLDESKCYGVPPFNPLLDKDSMIKRIADDAERSKMNSPELPTNKNIDDMDIATDEPSPTKDHDQNAFSHSLLSSTPKPACTSGERTQSPAIERCELNRPCSPSLTELENEKRLLLQELNGFSASLSYESLRDDSFVESNKDNSIKSKDAQLDSTHDAEKDLSFVDNHTDNKGKIDDIKEVKDEKKTENDSTNTLSEFGNTTDVVQTDEHVKKDLNEANNVKNDLEPDNVDTQQNEEKKKLYVENIKRTSHQTPIINYSQFSKIPIAESFSKEMSDVINFENLPDALGKYDNMRDVLSKVRGALNNLK